MKLMTKEIEEKFEKLGCQDGKEGHAIVVVKYFHPCSNWKWYALEYDPVNKIFFGLVDGHELEYGDFSLEELKSVKIMGLGIERDLYFGNPKLKDVMELGGRGLYWDKQ